VHVHACGSAWRDRVTRAEYVIPHGSREQRVITLLIGALRESLALRHDANDQIDNRSRFRISVFHLVALRLLRDTVAVEPSIS